MTLYAKILSAIFLLFVIVPNSFGQNRIITGKVTNELGEPVASATITFTGSREYGTMTGKDGSYRTNIPKNADSIRCRHLNYYTNTAKIDGNDLVNFVLAKHPYTTEVSVTGTHKYTPGEILVSQLTDRYIADDKIFTRVEMDAQFPGRNDSLKKYFEKAVVYPDSATISDVKGIVKVGFVVGIDGYPKSIAVLKGINRFADEAVVNAVKKMPRWRPALQNGSYTEQSREVSVSFDIKGSVQ